MYRPLAVILILLLVLPSHGQGILSRARLSIDGRGGASRPPAPPPPPDRLNVKSNWNDGLNGGGNSGEALAGAAIAAGFLATTPFWVPAFLFEQDAFGPGFFSAYPYALSGFGEYAQPGPKYVTGGKGAAASDEYDFFDPRSLKPWALRLGAEEGHDFGTLNRVGGRFAFDTKWRWGVTSNWDHFREKLPDGSTDETTLGDLNLTLRIAQGDWIVMHTGLGARGLFDRYHTRGGFNFSYGADLFPIKPLVVSTLIELGNIKEAFVMRLRAGAGIQLRHGEIFGGYDWLRIGSADLHGPMVGLRFWF